MCPVLIYAVTVSSSSVFSAVSQIHPKKIPANHVRFGISKWGGVDVREIWGEDPKPDQDDGRNGERKQALP